MIYPSSFANVATGVHWERSMDDLSDLGASGYLAPHEAQIFNAHLYIAAIGRSGSTYLANLLTSPPSRWVLTEPWFVNGVFTKSVRARCMDFGWPNENAHWWLPTDRRNHEGYKERYVSFLAPRLSALERWGVKEVRPDFHKPTIATINPRRVIILVRNMREIVASLVEKIFRQGQYDTKGPAWIENYCRESAAALLDLHQTIDPEKTRIVRYEELVNDPAERKNLADWLDWPMDGDPFLGLVEYNRGYEIERHTAIRGTMARSMPEDAAEVIETITAMNQAYQSYFGYH
jgi:hypothetical protein